MNHGQAASDEGLEDSLIEESSVHRRTVRPKEKVSESEGRGKGKMELTSSIRAAVTSRTFSSAERSEDEHKR